VQGWSPLYSFAQLRAVRSLLPREKGVYVGLYCEGEELLLQYVGSAVGKEGLWSRILFDREDAFKPFLPPHILERVLVLFYALPMADDSVVHGLEAFHLGFLQPPGNTLRARDRWTAMSDLEIQPGAHARVGFELLDHLKAHANQSHLGLVLPPLPWL
jgi:hypothetical protein